MEINEYSELEKRITKALRARLFLWSEGKISLPIFPDLTGIDFQGFIDHLSRTMPSGCSLSDYGKGIELDHRCPLNIWHDKTADTARVAFHYTNTRILYKTDNRTRERHYFNDARQAAHLDRHIDSAGQICFLKAHNGDTDARTCLYMALFLMKYKSSSNMPGGFTRQACRVVYIGYFVKQ